LIKNGDLTLDENSEITKQQFVDQFEQFGLAEDIIRVTTDENFRTNPLGKINPFEMNVIDKRLRPDGFPGSIVIEHFRSTGIRDGPRPREGAYNFGQKSCNPNLERWDKDSVKCFASVWDNEDKPYECLGSKCAPSNDVNGEERPDSCSSQDAGFEKCESALYHSIDNLRKAFGTPRGTEATISDTDWKALWIDSTYPPNFKPNSKQ